MESHFEAPDGTLFIATDETVTILAAGSSDQVEISARDLLAFLRHSGLAQPSPSASPVRISPDAPPSQPQP